MMNLLLPEDQVAAVEAVPSGGLFPSIKVLITTVDNVNLGLQFADDHDDIGTWVFEPTNHVYSWNTTEYDYQANGQSGAAFLNSVNWELVKTLPGAVGATPEEAAVLFLNAAFNHNIDPLDYVK